MICISGMFSVVYPSKCTKFLKNRQEVYDPPLNKISEDEGKYYSREKFEGHHPICQNYKTHTFLLMGRRYCAGCTGLFTGSVAAVVGTIIYYFYGNFSVSGILIFTMGIVFVFISLLENLFFKINSNIARLFFNMLLVIGSFLILVGVMEINSSLFVEFYFLVLVFVLIITRIAISERDHEIICLNCGEELSCPYY
jgi:hypothetical protein